MKRNSVREVYQIAEQALFYQYCLPKAVLTVCSMCSIAVRPGTTATTAVDILDNLILV